MPTAIGPSTAEIGATTHRIGRRGQRRRAQPRRDLPGLIILSLLGFFLSAGAGGCAASDNTSLAPTRIHGLDLIGSQSLPEIGAGQGVAVRGSLVYLYGDAETGIIVEYAQDWRDEPELIPTGRRVELTREGQDLIPHPTGLTFDPKHGTFIGNTVAGQGEIFLIDIERALEDGTLDNAVLNRVEDDVAVNGSRPEFVSYRGRRLIATSDYGPTGNEVRLYVPAALARASKTSDPGVLVEKWACGPWVQSLHWLEQDRTLVLVQNQIEGLGYRLSFAALGGRPSLVEAPRLDLERPRDELEGFALLDFNRSVLVSSSSANNVWFALARFGPIEGMELP